MPWVQSLSPFVAALIVLLGVVLTIRSNNRKGLYERLEQRTKDRETCLQDAYATFGSASYGVLACIGLIRGCMLARQQQDRGVLNLTAEQHKARAEETRKRFDDADAAKRQHFDAARSAYAKLALLDDSQERLKRAYEILLSMYQMAYTPDDGGANTAIENALQVYLASVASQLDAEYMEGLRLARLGQPYLRRSGPVRPFAGEAKKIA